MKCGNLFENLPASLPNEFFEVLAQGGGPVRIERIVSRGHASPDGFWYDQAEDEWVALLTGRAEVRLEDRTIALAPGDWLHLPAHCRHRVESTDPGRDTVWLAVFFQADSGEPDDRPARDDGA
ncbi:MAG: cupin domain-containing protein [Verrucomicrobiae bacterium]|nr:cupin domain-containing protein [Verrucomicrobiae bacterium]